MAGWWTAARVRWLLLIGLVAARVAVSSVLISRPGLQYDETLFVNAATLRIPGVFLSHSFDGIPLMVFPYIGALKSWLYTPVFAVLGNSPATIRVPVVLLTMAGLALLYLAVRDLVNRPVAVLAFVALCFDQSVFWLTRDDVGPSAIELFLKCAALWCVSRFARTGSLRWIWLLLAALGLGVFNKLNFIWTVNAAALVSVLVAVRFRQSLRSNPRAAGVWFGGLALLYVCFAAYYFGAHIGSLVPGPGGNSVFQPVAPFAHGIGAILSGTWFYSYALGPLTSRNVAVVIIVALFVIGSAGSVVGRTRSLVVAGLGAVTVLIALQVLATPQATAGWHYLSIYPFVTVVAAYGAFVVARTLFARAQVIQIALACLGGLALTYDAALAAKYIGDLSSREPTNPAWSPAIYRLSRALARTRAQIFTADWGISNPLFALRPSRDYTELAFALRHPTVASLKGLGVSLSSTPGPKLIVTHTTPDLVFPSANANLFEATAGRLRPAIAVDGVNGAPVYEVYEYTASARPPGLAPRETKGGRIFATPDPLPLRSGASATTVTWQAPGSRSVAVVVSEDGGTPKLFTRGGSSGSATASFIAFGHTYDFELFRWPSGTTLLASVLVIER